MITYAKKERAKYWPVPPELMAQYKDGSHTEKDEYNSLYWLNQNGLFHRDGDKPAFIGANDHLEWCQNDLRHRNNDKPAEIWANGTVVWRQNDQRHRFCGPAVIYQDDKLEWFIYDKNITKEVNDWVAGEEWRGTPEQIFEFQLRFT